MLYHCIRVTVPPSSILQKFLVWTGKVCGQRQPIKSQTNRTGQGNVILCDINSPLVFEDETSIARVGNVISLHLIYKICCCKYCPMDNCHETILIVQLNSHSSLTNGQCYFQWMHAFVYIYCFKCKSNNINRTVLQQRSEYNIGRYLYCLASAGT